MFVQDNGDGTYSVVKDGQIVYTDADQHKAEQWLNEHNDATPPTGTTPTGGLGRLTSLFDKLFASLSNTKQQDLDFEKEKYAKTLEEEKRQFDKGYELKLKELQARTDLSKEQIAVRREEMAAQKEQFYADLETKRSQFNDSMVQRRKEFDATLEQSKTQLYAQVGTTLLGIAPTLRGPENWQSYLDFASGSKGLLGALRGDKPVSEFAQPGGYSKAYDINSLLNDLGLKLPGGTTPTTPAPTTPVTPAEPTTPAPPPTGTQPPGAGRIDPKDLARMNPIIGGPVGPNTNFSIPDTSTLTSGEDLSGITIPPNLPGGQVPPYENYPMGANASNASDNDAARLISTLLGQFGQPGGNGQGQNNQQANQQSNPNNLATGPQGYSNPAMAMTRGTGQANQILSDLMGPGGTSIIRKGPVPTPTMVQRKGPQVLRNVNIDSPEGAVRTQQQDTRMPLPYQINPMVWDSLSDSAKQFIFGQVERGNTPTGVWTAADYLRQLNAARPKGTAARQTNFLYRNPSSLF